MLLIEAIPRECRTASNTMTLSGDERGILAMLFREKMSGAPDVGVGSHRTKRLALNLVLTCINLEWAIRITDIDDLLEVDWKISRYRARLLILMHVPTLMREQTRVVVPVADVNAVTERESDHSGPEETRDHRRLLKLRIGRLRQFRHHEDADVVRLRHPDMTGN